MVAPLVGAWIETYLVVIKLYLSMSHPSWVRGLKLVHLVISKLEQRSHPSWVRGLKLVHLVISKLEQRSHPSWVRGLKHARTNCFME